MEIRREEYMRKQQSTSQIFEEFYGKPFIDNQLSYIYIYKGSVDTDLITLQEEEVESVEWMAVDEVIRRLDDPSFPNCIYLEELDKLKAYLAEHPGCIY